MVIRLIRSSGKVSSLFEQNVPIEKSFILSIRLRLNNSRIMLNIPKRCVTLFFIVSMMIASTCGHPGKEKLKIRIHVPVEHHTHVHTKTIIKKVPVPIPVPVKEHHEAKKIEPEDFDDDFEGYDYPKKKRRTRHPFA